MGKQPFIIRLSEEYDAFNVEELRRSLDPARDGSDAVIDFSATRYVDSSCLKELATLRRIRVDRGLSTPHLVVPGRNIRKILQIVGFDQIFPLFESLDEAIQQIEQSADQQISDGEDFPRWEPVGNHENR